MIKAETSQQETKNERKLKTNSKIKVSCGILKIPVSGELKLHHHDPQEIYLIRSGEALLLKSDGHTEKVFKDSVVYIPMGFSHGLKNIGNSFLELLWIFPTNCWNEVEYQFET